MKSLKDYSLNLTEEQYHELPVWSYSIIAKYARNGFSAISTLHDRVKPTPEMEFGTLFDSILTKGRETLNDYIVTDFSVPPAEKGALDRLVDVCTCTQFHDISVEQVMLTLNEVGYQPKWKSQTRYDHVAEYSRYYDAIKSGKKIVSQKDWEDAVEMARVFRSDPYLKELFGTKSTDKVEYIYQAKFLVKFVVDGKPVQVKFMPDLMVVNHTQKTIQLVDLKTSSLPGYKFVDSFVHMRYDLQGELYTDGMKALIETDEDYRDYTVLPYLFTDISRTDKIPVTYEVDLSDGFSFMKGDKLYKYKGWKQLLAEILAYEESNARVPNNIRLDGPNDLVAILYENV